MIARNTSKSLETWTECATSDSASSASYVVLTERELVFAGNSPDPTVRVLRVVWLCSCVTVCEVLCGGRHMQLTTLLEPWPTSLMRLTWDEHTATPAPARQWDTQATSSHLNAHCKRKTVRKGVSIWKRQQSYRPHLLKYINYQIIVV